jgi:hypothetical protein
MIEPFATVFCAAGLNAGEAPEGVGDCENFELKLESQLLLRLGSLLLLPEPCLPSGGLTGVDLAGLDDTAAGGVGCVGGSFKELLLALVDCGVSEGAVSSFVCGVGTAFDMEGLRMSRTCSDGGGSRRGIWWMCSVESILLICASLGQTWKSSGIATLI